MKRSPNSFLREMNVLRLFLYLSSVLMLALPVLGQTAGLRGQITDETGSVVPGTTVRLTGPSGSVQTTASKSDGTYLFSGLAPGEYSVQASAPSLALPEAIKVSLKSGVQTLNLQLKVVMATQQVAVQGNVGPTVSTAAESNASATVLRGNDLQALGDDPEDLQSDLQALAGPSAGPSGGTAVDRALSSLTCGCRKLSPLEDESAAAAGLREVTEATADGSKAARLTWGGAARQLRFVRPALHAHYLYVHA